MALKREDQYIIHCSVTGVNFPSVFSWSEMDDGSVEAADTKVYPGGMMPQRNLGGPSSRADVTVKRPYSTAIHPYITQLENVCGKASCRVSWTPLDASGNPDGNPQVITGILKKVEPPARNANNSAAAFLTLVIGADTEATGP